MPADAAAPRTKARRWVLVLTTGIGLALTSAPIAIEATWGWTGAVPATMTEIGAALLLAGALFFLEPYFVRQVTDASGAAIGAAAKTAAEEAIQPILEQAAALERRVSDLTEATRERLAAKARREDADLAAVVDDVTFESIVRAFENVNDLAAIHEGRLVVSAARSGPSGLHVEFRWGRWKRRMGGAGTDYGDDELHVLALAPIEPRPDASSDPPQVEWRPGAEPDEVGAELARRLQAERWWTGDDCLDWSRVLQNVVDGLGTALRSRRREAGAWELEGDLIEVVGPDWVITTAGIAAPDHGLRIPAARFAPTNDKGISSRVSYPDPPIQPEWTDVLTWRYLLVRAREIFGTPGIVRVLMERDGVEFDPKGTGARAVR